MADFFEKVFHLKKEGTSFRTEVLAGLTTFLTMSYIIFLQPAVLSKDFGGNPTGMDFGAILLATCLSAACSSIFMGLYAKYPIALAPGMGENFFFVSVIMSLTAMGVRDAWQTALGIVFISGVIFFALSALRVREAIIDAVSPSMRNGIAVGIGLFITFIGLQHGRLIIDKPGTLVGLNTHFAAPDILVFFTGLIVTSVLRVRKVRGAILWGILAGAFLALCLGKIQYQGIFGFPVIKQSLIFKMNVVEAFRMAYLPFIMVFLFMDMFDTVGTLVGVAEAAGFMDGNRLPRADRVLVVDAAWTVGGACLGTSTVTSYIESAAGVAFGGRTGLTSVTVGALFFAALLFGPFIGMIGNYPPITAPALVIVGVMMIESVKKIDWDDPSESIPAFLTMIGIPFCYSIADGLALGFISYPVIKLLSGRGRDMSWLMIVLAGLLLVYFIFVRGHLG
ncbi:MAG: NCS2 family permease [Candidatus Omnitrophota bacterium]|jgi:AGZA family xanthine/uracil permease-like MFS transporter